MGLVKPAKGTEIVSAANLRTDDMLKRYTEEDVAELQKKFTPAQMQVIREAEEAVDLEDLRNQGRFRQDPYVLPYRDDLNVVRPVVDKRFQRPSTISVNARLSMEGDEEDPELGDFKGDGAAFDQLGDWAWKSMQEAKAAEEEFLAKNPGKTLEDMSAEDMENARPMNRLSFMKLVEEPDYHMMTGGGKAGTPSLAPGLPKIPDMVGQFTREEDVDQRDPDGKYTRLMKQTGMTLDSILDAKVKILVNHRVVNQTRLGKIQSIYVLAIAGNGQGRLGLGQAKAQEPDEAADKARQAAIRNMRPIPRYEERTIYGQVEAKVSATIVQLMARPPGFGLRCQSSIFEMARAAGIQDLSARVPRSRNKMNTVKATYEALMNQRLPDDIARGRGKKLVDVRKVYYGGDQPTPRILAKISEERMIRGSGPLTQRERQQSNRQQADV